MKSTTSFARLPRAPCIACGRRAGRRAGRAAARAPAPTREPPNAYAAKFSQPYCIAAGFVLGHAGLEAFTEERVRDPRLRAVASRVRYEIDPDNPYPDEFTGHVRVRMKDGSVHEERQAHFRGGAHEPLSREDLEEKFPLDCGDGGGAPGAPRPVSRSGENRVQRPGRSVRISLKNRTSASSVWSGASAIGEW